MTVDGHGDPLYDQWQRVLPGTGSAAIVAEMLDATANVRSRPNFDDKPFRKLKRDAELTHHAIVHALVSALVRRHLTVPWGWTRVPLAHPRYRLAAKGRPQRMRSPKYKAKRQAETQNRYYSRAVSQKLSHVVKALDAAGWIQLQIFESATKERRPSLVRASQTLVALIEKHHAALTDFGRDPEETVVILRGEKPKTPDGRGRLTADLLDYPTTPDTLRKSEELKRINAWLASADISYSTNGDRVDHVNDRALRRIFNNGSFEKGGRLYGGFWQPATMSPKGGHAWRGNIRIEGERVVIIDFSSSLLRLLYAEAKVQPPAGDLYLGIPSLDYDYGPSGGVRDAVKRVISAMLFRVGDLQKLPLGTRLLLPKGWTGKRLHKAILNRHAPVANKFGKALGYRLMWLESEVLLEALNRCRELNVIALPVHDAVIVKESHAAFASAIMLAAFKAKTGFEGAIGEPKRPGIGESEIETVIDTSGELPTIAPFEKFLRYVERSDGREMASDLAVRRAVDYSEDQTGPRVDDDAEYLF